MTANKNSIQLRCSIRHFTSRILTVHSLKVVLASGRTAISNTINPKVSQIKN